MNRGLRQELGLTEQPGEFEVVGGKKGLAYTNRVEGTGGLPEIGNHVGFGRPKGSRNDLIFS